MAQCLSRNAAYILCPCCIGKLQNEIRERGSDDAKKPDEGCVITHPRSNWLKTHVTYDRYKSLARLADVHTFGAAGPAGEIKLSEAKDNDAAAVAAATAAVKFMAYRRLCKAVLECDRNQCSLESKGYEVMIGKLVPTNCSTKNDILLGLPPPPASPPPPPPSPPAVAAAAAAARRSSSGSVRRHVGNGYVAL
uniref:Uncharacterized protein n=1 Tax=Lotharella oceanica TaxID=641309 RepID=A0A7S2TZF8_9EUKA